MLSFLFIKIHLQIAMKHIVSVTEINPIENLLNAITVKNSPWLPTTQHFSFYSMKQSIFENFYAHISKIFNIQEIDDI